MEVRKSSHRSVLSVKLDYELLQIIEPVTAEERGRSRMGTKSLLLHKGKSFPSPHRTFLFDNK